MPSRMGRTKNRRKLAAKRLGKEGKRDKQNKGTTPKFSIHLDEKTK